MRVKNKSSRKGEKETDEEKRMTQDPANICFESQSCICLNIKAQPLMDNQDETGDVGRSQLLK